jgi:hypothetical protein
MSIAITASILAGAIALSGAPTPTAPTPTDLDPNATLTQIQQLADRAIDNRTRALDGAIQKVDDNTYLTDAHQSTISATLQGDLDGLNDLAGQIDAATTAAKARALYHSIFTDYRVYAVVLPQSFYAAAADGLEDAALPKLEDGYTRLAAAVDKSGDSDLKAILAQMRASLDTATGLLNGLADEALAVSPSDFNADHTVLGDIRGTLRDATNAVRDARQDAREILDGLR